MSVSSTSLEQSLSWTDFQAAHHRLSGHGQAKGGNGNGPTSSAPLVGPAPLKYSRWLSEAVGGSVWLKLECLNEGGSFKLRGATHALLAYRDGHGGSLPTHVFSARQVKLNHPRSLFALMLIVMVVMVMA